MRGRARSARRRFAPVAACAALCFSLANCANNNHIDPRYGVEPSARLVEPGNPVPKGGGTYRVGSPYVVAGRVYVPENNPHYRADGVASWYGADFHGRSTANGEIFDAEAITAAHPTLPLPSYVRVSNLSNGRSLIVRVNDRGPYAGNRIIDVSKHAAQLLGFTVNGTAFPVLNVYRRKYRFRFLGASVSRIYELMLMRGTPTAAPGTQGQYQIPDAQQCHQFTQIASEGGLLPKPITRDSFQIWPAKRREVVVDFTKFMDGTPTSPGDVLYLVNILEMPDGRKPNFNIPGVIPAYKVPIMKIIIGGNPPEPDVSRRCDEFFGPRSEKKRAW